MPRRCVRLVETKHTHKGSQFLLCGGALVRGVGGSKRDGGRKGGREGRKGASDGIHKYLKCLMAFWSGKEEAGEGRGASQQHTQEFELYRGVSVRFGEVEARRAVVLIAKKGFRIETATWFVNARARGAGGA